MKLALIGIALARPYCTKIFLENKTNRVQKLPPKIILPHCVSPGILTRNKKSPGLLLDKNAVSVG